jgi:hypothetical protein
MRKYRKKFLLHAAGKPESLAASAAVGPIITKYGDQQSNKQGSQQQHMIFLPPESPSARDKKEREREREHNFEEIIVPSCEKC